MPYLEKMALHLITGANYVTSVNGMLHPDRILAEHDFLYMLEGTWEILEENTSYDIQNDDLLILTAGKHHYGKKLCNPGNRHMYIHARPTSAEQHYNAGAKMDNPETLFACPSLLHCGQNPKIRQYFHEIITVGWTRTPEQQNRLSLLFSLLLCELAELPSYALCQPPSDAMVEEICQRIRTTPQTFFSAVEIAANYYICERTLNNRFLKTCGKSFYAFQMETKLEMVRQFLLSQPQAKLHEAAINYGFYDEFHLSKTFKKRFGVAPSEYRRQHRDRPGP